MYFIETTRFTNISFLILNTVIEFSSKANDLDN